MTTQKRKPMKKLKLTLLPFLFSAATTTHCMIEANPNLIKELELGDISAARTILEAVYNPACRRVDEKLDEQERLERCTLLASIFELKNPIKTIDMLYKDEKSNEYLRVWICQKVFNGLGFLFGYAPKDALCHIAGNCIEQKLIKIKPTREMFYIRLLRLLQKEKMKIEFLKLSNLIPQSYINIESDEWTNLKKDVEKEKNNPYLSKVVALENSPLSKNDEKERIQFLLENDSKEGNTTIKGLNFELELGPLGLLLAKNIR